MAVVVEEADFLQQNGRVGKHSGLAVLPRLALQIHRNYAQTPFGQKQILVFSQGTVSKLFQVQQSRVSVGYVFMAEPRHLFILL